MSKGPKIGGKKGKTFAHKRIDTGKQFLLPNEEDGEHLAIVTKICGNGVFYVTASNRAETIAYLPGRMKGPNKRNNLVIMYSVVLISTRKWETNQKHSDILHIYSNHHIQSIVNLYPEKMKYLLSLNANSMMSCGSSSDSVVFTNEQPVAIDLHEEMPELEEYDIDCI